MFLAKIKVVLKQSILDPQGQTILHALENLGYNSVKELRVGKYIELKLNEDDDEVASKLVNEICDKLLANPVMENYFFEIEKVDR